MKTEESFEEIFDRYCEKFGGFPTFAVMGIGEEELIEILKKCLETGEAYIPHYDENCDY